MVAAGVTGVLCYLAKFQFSRGFFFLLILIGIPSLLLGRLVLRRLLHAERRRGHLAHRVVVAGSGAQVDEVARVLNRESWLGYHVIGAVLPAEETTDHTEAGVPVLGSTARTAAVVADSDCDIVLFAGGAVTSAQAMRRAAWEPRRHTGADHARPRADRRRERPRPGPARGRAPAHGAGGPSRPRGHPHLEAHLRRRGCQRAPRAVQPADARHRTRDPPPRPWSGALPAAARRPQRRPLRPLQVPLHARRCRLRGRHRHHPQQARRRPRALQGRGGPAHHRAGAGHPALLARRDAAVPQRPARAR